MKKNKSNKILIIGPLPEETRTGGVVTHMKMLKSLRIFRTAVIFDPGSINKVLSIESFQILLNCLWFGEHRKKDHFDHILINTSIYPTAIIKLLLILFGIKKSKKTKIRVFFHGGRFEKITLLKNSFIHKLTLPLLKKVDSYHLLSKEQGNGFKAMFPTIQWCLYKNYLTFNDILNSKKSDQKIILFVGRITKEKGIYEIISAIKQLKKEKKSHNFFVIFAGDGPEMGNLEKIVEKSNLDEVQLLGKIQPFALSEIYAKSYMLLLPSYHEGLPYVVIEAMRAGLPIIATPTGALTDIIKNEVNGLIVPKKNFELLANSIKRILDDKKLYKKLSQNNYKKYKSTFSLAAAEKYYSCLLKK